MSGFLHARIVAVGSELLDGDRVDTNSPWLAGRLGRLGVKVAGIVAVPDDAGAIAEVVRGASRAPLAFVCGGLGPTSDDRTRDGVARAFDVRLSRSSTAEAAVRRALERVGRSPGPDQLRQADLPAGAEPLENPVGIAPGFLVTQGAHRLFALPGVPAELEGTFERAVSARIGTQGRPAIARTVLRIAGRAESEVDQLLRQGLTSDPNEWSILAGAPGVEVVLRSQADSYEAAAARTGALEAEVRRRLGPDVYGRDDETLAGVVGASLLERGLTVACAESCTAGLVSAALTEIPGSSAWFRGGLVLYADDLKRTLASVPAEVLLRAGAVSEEVARLLAEAARSRCEAQFGIGVTGIAGPGGGTAAKPVGLVHFALAGPDRIECWAATFSGGRGNVRRRAVNAALDRLRRLLVHP